MMTRGREGIFMPSRVGGGGRAGNGYARRRRIAQPDDPSSAARSPRVSRVVSMRLPSIKARAPVPLLALGAPSPGEAQLARPLALVADRGAGHRGDVHALQEASALRDGAPGVGEVGAAVSHHFPPPADDHPPRLEPLAQLVV